MSRLASNPASNTCLCATIQLDAASSKTMALSFDLSKLRNGGSMLLWQLHTRVVSAPKRLLSVHRLAETRRSDQCDELEQRPDVALLGIRRLPLYHLANDLERSRIVGELQQLPVEVYGLVQHWHVLAYHIGLRLGDKETLRVHRFAVAHRPDQYEECKQRPGVPLLGIRRLPLHVFRDHSTRVGEDEHCR